MLLRRIAFPLLLAARRLAAGGRRHLLVAVGVVAGAAVLAAVLGGRLVMQDRSLALATQRLAPGDRTVQVAWDGDDAHVWPRLDRIVAPQLERLTGRPPARAMLFREASIQGRLVNLRAADDLGRYVRLVSGRLPTICRPSHCEVLRLKGKGPIPSTPYLRLVQVGRAVLKPGAAIAPFVLPAPRTEEVARAVRYHTPQPSPVVIANGVAGLARTPELETFYRSYAWFEPVGRGDVHPWTLGAFARRVQSVSSAIEARSPLLEVTAPIEQLTAADDGSRAAARRMLLLGGEGGALLLAFTILAASSLREEAAAARRRLIFFGARRWQVELSTLAESTVLAGAATAAGWIAGGAVAAVVASEAGSPAGQVVDHALLGARGLAAAALLATAAALLLYASVRAPALRLGRLAPTPLDAAALGAAAVVLVGWARGSIDAGQLASGGGTGAFLLLVPGLIVFAASVALARLLAPALRALGRASRGGSIALRLAATSLARNPGRAAVAATFLAASLGLALFAACYRSTLLQGQSDEAAYAVPASFVLDEDLEQLVPVLHGAPASAYPARPERVLRLSGNVPAGATFAFLGLPARRLETTGGWRRNFASLPPARLGRLIAPTRDVRLRADALPPGRLFTLPVSTSGDDVSVQAVFRSRLGDSMSVPLGRTRGRERVLLHGRIPFPHAALAQLEVDLLNGGRRVTNGGIGIQPSAKGVLSLGMPSVDGQPVRRAFAGWRGSGGVSGTGGRVGYLLTSDLRGVFRPRQPTDGRLLPVLATPAVAAAAGPRGIVPLQVEGERVPARVVGVVRRFPSVVGDAVIADRTAASTVLDTDVPGLGVTDELWLNVPASREAETAALLARPPFTALTVSSRSARLARLREDPLARGAQLTLAGTAAVALALGLLGLLLAVAGDARDDRGELFDLEAQGAAPATIRAHLRLRAALVAGFGTAGGLALGAILSLLVLSLVAVTAGAGEPEPPLRLALDLRLLGLGALVYVALAALLVGLATRSRGAAPARAAEAAV